MTDAATPDPRILVVMQATFRSEQQAALLLEVIDKADPLRVGGVLPSNPEPRYTRFTVGNVMDVIARLKTWVEDARAEPVAVGSISADLSAMCRTLEPMAPVLPSNDNSPTEAAAKELYERDRANEVAFMPWELIWEWVRDAYRNDLRLAGRSNDEPTGPDKIREAIRRDRGGDAPTRIQGFA